MAAPAAPWMQDTLRQGYSLLAAGRLREASECCRRLLGAKPDLVEAHFLVGLVALQAEDTRVAVSAFGSVTELEPKHGAAWAQLARLFMRMGHVNRADDALARAVANNDGNPAVLEVISTVYSLLGDQAEASHWIDKAVALQPRRVSLLVNQANNRLFHGRMDDAAAALAAVFEQQPDNPNAHWLLSGLRKAKDHAHVEQLQTLAERMAGNPRAMAYLYYGMGKELEDLEDWDAAFEAYSQAAAARRQTVHYDERAEDEAYRALSETFTADWLASANAGHEDASPVFVVGQPRTGTTLVERIITSHSQVHSAGELRQFGSCIRRLANYAGKGRDSAELVRASAAIEPATLGRAYLHTSAKMRGDKPYFVDKLPPNYRHLPLILAALPNAKIVHVCRHPMDACFASYKQLFADAYPHSYDQQEMARHHARYRHLLDDWRERFGERFFDVTYEDIAANFEPGVRELLDWLGLPFEQACLEFHKQAAAVTTASAAQVREPVHTRSIGRWRRYEAQLAPMREALEMAGIAVE